MGVGKVKKGRKAKFTVFADIQYNRNNTLVEVVAGGHLFTYSDLVRLAKLEKRFDEYRSDNGD
jgi:hypothetical protein